MSFPEPIAISDFSERPSTLSFGHCDHHTTIEFGNVDLGSYVVDMEVLREHNLRFTTSLPSFADDEFNTEKMRAYHAADFWFIKNLAFNLKVPYKIIHECMFLHL